MLYAVSENQSPQAAHITPEKLIGDAAPALLVHFMLKNCIALIESRRIYKYHQHKYNKQQARLSTVGRT